MPYIEEKRRKQLNEGSAPATAGELNYNITTLLIWYMKTKGLSYQTINDIRGVLTCVGDEFYRRVAVRYEDKKVEMNGDVYND